ncbi:MAG: DNA ligase-1 [Patescibacteria group bacterium]|jgi:DNA ligase-1
MNYSKLCLVYHALESTTKGLEKTQIISKFLEEIGEDTHYIYLLQGRVYADYNNQELGMSGQLVVRAIAKASGLDDKSVIEEFKHIGDLGKVAEKLLSKEKRQQSLFSSKLSVDKVIANLKKIGTLEGKGTVETKIGLVVDLFHSATPQEAKYITRTVIGDLRVGVGNGILRDAIVQNTFSPESMEEKKVKSALVQDAYDKATDFALVYKMAKNNTLDEIALSVGKPVKVMLYPKAKSAEDAFRIVGKPAAFEYKYDGFRVMVNKNEKGEVKIFTRRLEEVSHQFPDIVKYVKTHVKGESFIIDGEAVGFDPKNKTYTDFQAISQRIRRKQNIDMMAKKVPVEFRVFDVILYEGKSLIEDPYENRRKVIKRIIKEEKWKIMLAQQIVTDNIDEAEVFFQAALDEGQEGLMVKGLDKKYKPGARIGYGVKWKPEDKDFDVVITGAEWGTGKRSGWLTSFEVACNDDGILKNIGKVSTGLKEKEEEGLSFKEMTKILKELQLEEHGTKITVSPKIVITVQYQDIQKSQNYNSGYALRFPRITKLRPDRGVSDIATIDEVAEEAR